MKRSLFICNTYYQLIVAIQIKITLKKDENVALVVTDHIKNCEQIRIRLLKLNLFEVVCTMKARERKSSLIYFINGVLGKAPKEIQNIKYDEIVGYNLDLDTHGIYACVYKNNKNIVVNKMEEGLLSYNTPDTNCRVMRAINKTRKILGRKNVREDIGYFYCFSPIFYKGSSEPVAIPKIRINDIKFKDILKIVFIDHELQNFREKYIFLFSIFDIEGGKPIGEFDLALRIAEIVGKENMIVKIHPRDDAKRFKNVGLKMIDSNIPWEVLQLHLNFSDKVLITTLSGSLLNLNSILDVVPKTYYGYKLCNLSGNCLAEDSQRSLEAFLSNDVCEFKNINILKNIEELLAQ